MTQRCGDRATFAVEVGGVATPGMRVVDLWAAGRRLTVDDNAAYVPSLLLYMRIDAQREVAACPFPGRSPTEVFRLLDEDETELRERFRFLQWTEIVDNVTAFAYRDGDLVIVFGFWRESHPVPEEVGQVFTTRIRPSEFAAIVEQAADLLAAEPSR
ncbi:hypothetical protein FB565_008674 [Actinoplanes lutulentus]|uniref:Uncharacterized protein n=1 Tax=Actinoplanes lutulentus TaxID=1287878 RepID=A0A327ZBJ1_9ACTN|nr:hypothetical protein [Actinoplanes lutulentus]MBB2948888.1 hypothetical protein [Actinoplanes lutulentus]RAK29798.1 hypothetical protein B0I29_117124 [Actinoplanes lutulentus]